MLLTQYNIRWLFGAALCSVALHSASFKPDKDNFGHTYITRVATEQYWVGSCNHTNPQKTCSHQRNDQPNDFSNTSVRDIVGVSAAPAEYQSHRCQPDKPQCNLDALRVHACQSREQAGTNTA